MDIVERNKDIEHIMLASCRYGVHYLGEWNQDKLFSMLVTTDLHRCGAQLSSALQYLHHYDALDCGICLGDIQGANHNEQYGTWYTDIVQTSKKPFFTVVGNHDVWRAPNETAPITQKMAVEKYIRPVAVQIGIEDLQTPYYVKTFDEYKIALVVLCYYDAPNDDENAQLLELFSQKQIDWLVQTLQAIPKEYHLLIAMHDFSYKTRVILDDWTQPDWSYDKRPFTAEDSERNLLTDIVQAWIEGGVLRKTYSEQTEGVSNVTVDCDFSTRGKGDFICYLLGHMHKDILAVCDKYPNQRLVYCPSSAYDAWQNKFSDLPRTAGTKSEDCLTVFSVDTQKRKIRLVRVGSNITVDMTERTYKVLDY